MKKIAIMMVTLLMGSPLFAAHPLATDDAATVPVQGFELEIGYDNCIPELGERTRTGCFSLKHGVSERVDIGIAIPYAIEPQLQERFGNALWGLKFNLLKDLFAVTVTNEMGGKHYLVNGILSRSYGRISGHFNAGYQTSGDPDIAGAALYRLAGVYEFERIDVVGEASHDDGEFIEWLGGLRYKMGKIGFFSLAAGRTWRGDGDKASFGFHTEF